MFFNFATSCNNVIYDEALHNTLHETVKMCSGKPFSYLQKRFKTLRKNNQIKILKSSCNN